MFMKKVMVAMMSSALLIGTMPVEAATFGKSSSSSTRSSTFSSGSTSRSSSFSSPSSSRSTSTYSSSTSTSRGGISQGSSIGMSRSNVANNVKNGTYSAPSNGTTVAGSNPGYSNSGSYSNNRNYNNGSYNNRNYNNGNYNNGGYNNGGYNNNYPQQQGHSTGALVGAAAVAGVAGYALGSHNNNNHGTTVVVPNGGAPVGGAPVVAGNGGYVSGNGAPVIVDNNGNYTTAPVAGAPVVVAPQSSSFGSGVASFIWTLIKIIVGLAILYFIVRLIMNFFSRRNTGSSIGSGFSSAPVFNTKTPEDEIRDMKENFFVQFQQNNRPSGLNHIRQNSTPVFYNAVEDMVREQSDTRSVKVRQLEAELVDLTQDGSRYIASVRYHAVVAEGDNGNMQDSEVKELWNFVYENNTWKLAGIDQL